MATSAAARVADGATRYAISSGATSALASGEATANSRTSAHAAGIVVELRSFTVVFRRETSVAPATDAFALQFGGIRAELDSPEGVALRVEVQDLDGWLPSDGTDASSRHAMVWPRVAVRGKRQPAQVQHSAWLEGAPRLPTQRRQRLSLYIALLKPLSSQSSLKRAVRCISRTSRRLHVIFTWLSLKHIRF